MALLNWKISNDIKCISINPILLINRWGYTLSADDKGRISNSNKSLAGSQGWMVESIGENRVFLTRKRSNRDHVLAINDNGEVCTTTNRVQNGWEEFEVNYYGELGLFYFQRVKEPRYYLACSDQGLICSTREFNLDGWAAWRIVNGEGNVIKCSHSNRILQASNDVLTTKPNQNTSDEQKWILNRVKDYYVVINVASGKVLDGNPYDTHGRVWQYHGGDNQHWYINKEAGIIKNVLTGRVLDGDLTNEKVHVWDYHGNANQRWIINENNPKVNRDTIYKGNTLRMGESLTSENGRFIAIMQEDGNFVVYKNGQAIWASGTWSKGERVDFQNDGNLVVYIGNKPTWSSNTHGRNSHSLRMQNDGNLVIYDQSERPLWATNTHDS